MGYHAKTLWLTGLSGAGKSTVANIVAHELNEYSSMATALLDADDIRPKLWPELGYSEEDRAENVRRFARLAHSLNTRGITTLVAVIAPTEAMRAEARKIIGKDSYIEVFVDAPIEKCAERDPKGLYKRAAKGEIEDFTGVAKSKAADYEPPWNPHLHLHTDREDPEECARRVYWALVRHH